MADSPPDNVVPIIPVIPVNEKPPETPQEPAEAAPEPQAAPAPAVTVNQRTKRDDADVYEGHPAVVVDGEHAGQVGAYVKTIASDPEDGYPLEILIRFKNTNYTHEYATVPYASVRPAEHPGSQ